MFTLVDTLIENTGYNLIAADDQLLETSAGSLIDYSLDYCVAVLGSGAYTITIDGLCYAEDDKTYVAIGLNSGSTNLYVNGEVEGNIGVQVTGQPEETTTANNYISVGAEGSIVGLTAEAVLLGGNSSIVTNDTLINAGEISASLLGQDAIIVAEGAGDLISNSGLISGSVGLDYSDNIGTETVENSGTIKGGDTTTSAAIFSDGSTAGIDIVNSGNITDGANNAAGAYGLVYFLDASGVRSTLDNEGTIIGLGYVIQSGSDILDLSNSGTIHGGIYLKTGLDVITNSKTGVIDGPLSIASGGDMFTNAGAIDGGIAFTGSGATDTVTNSGEITGNISVASAHSLLSNSGSITGNISLSATETLHNYASIFGNVTESSGDYIVNYGVIHGDEALTASDTLAITGDVTGTITASTNDLLAFKGNFGNETVSDFIAGTGSTHDKIEFWGTTLSTFAQVQAASTTVGSDTVIRMDTNDALTLRGIAPSSLVSADFTFV